MIGFSALPEPEPWFSSIVVLPLMAFEREVGSRIMALFMMAIELPVTVGVATKLAFSIWPAVVPGQDYWVTCSPK